MMKMNSTATTTIKVSKKKKNGPPVLSLPAADRCGEDTKALFSAVVAGCSVG